MLKSPLSRRALKPARALGHAMSQGLCLMLATLVIQSAAPSLAQAQTGNAPTPPSADAFGRVAALSSLAVSPDGKHLAAVTSVDGKTAQITVWNTDNLSKPLAVLGSAPQATFISVDFAKNERLVVRVRQLADFGNYRGHTFKQIFTDLTGSKWFTGVPEEKLGCVSVCTDETRVLETLTKEGRVVGNLPFDPQSILVFAPDGTVYKSNLYTGKYDFVASFASNEDAPFFDSKGVLRAFQRSDERTGNESVVQLLLNPQTNKMEEHFRSLLREREIPSVVGLTPNPDIVLIRTRRDKDNTAIYNYSISQRKFLDVAFEHPLFDAGGVRVNPETQEVTSFSYVGDRVTRYYVDDKLNGLMVSVEKALGVKSNLIDWTPLAGGAPVKLRITDGPSIRLAGSSDDNKTLIFAKEGAGTPVVYYLYREGQPIIELGRERPWIDTRLLSDGTLKQYKARDGRPVPAFVYKPNAEVYGKGPYPTLIIPHGGPWARDYNEDVDAWVQYFVARGYAVAKPQFRGSEEWGMAQWSAGDNKWGEEMSDDMDDVALGMVADGIADSKRIAMHGYSFGGYSAMAAIVRPNTPYQCAISGAGLPSPVLMQDRTEESKFLKIYQRPFVGGLNATAHVKEASIPILIYHGDRDTNVLPRLSLEYHDALKAAGKKTQRVVFKDMGHPGLTWKPEDMTNMLLMIDKYLQTDCKPGGL